MKMPQAHREVPMPVVNVAATLCEASELLLDRVLAYVIEQEVQHRIDRDFLRVSIQKKLAIEEGAIDIPDL